MATGSMLARAGAVLLGVTFTTGGSAPAADCADPDASSLDPGCVLEATAAHLVRTVCDPLWLPDVCDPVAFPEPGYRPPAPPSSLGDGEFLPAFGAVHEHSSYSDGDPEAIPRDYFAAARTGANGVRLDFLMSSEHSDNEKLPVTTSRRCIQEIEPGVEAVATFLTGNDPAPLASWIESASAAGPATIVSDALLCSQVEDPDHHFKWSATLEQAAGATDFESGEYTGFTAIRGFEWTNDIQNHLNVYFSRNVVNAKTDGSYLSMDFFWNWLREPPEQGGGADALVTFNHPGGTPKLTPFDGGLPHGELLRLVFTGNWNDLAYVRDVDEAVVGMEVNGGDDIEWYVKALDKGWHLGAVAAEDHHETGWASIDQEKTVVLTKGRSPRHYYEAMRARRIYALLPGAFSAAPDGTPAFPDVRFFADAPTDATSMGARIADANGAVRTLHVSIENGPVGSRVALVGSEGSLAAPIDLGLVTGASFSGAHSVTSPAGGERWWFVVVHRGDVTRDYQVVTAPIWIGPAQGTSLTE